MEVNVFQFFPRIPCSLLVKSPDSGPVHSRQGPVRYIKLSKPWVILEDTESLLEKQGRAGAGA